MTTRLELMGPQYGVLGEALRATLRLGQFDQMLKQRLDINREDIALGEDYREIVFKVISEANRAGWVYKLVNALRQERPSIPVFVEYAAILGIGPRNFPDISQLESIVNKANSLLDIAGFRSRLGQIEGQVCRVELRGNGIGTGFLVGASTVMTNFHVIEGIANKQQKIEDLTCLFDFKVHEDGMGICSGTTIKVIELIKYSPYDLADLNKNSKQPEPSNLDYALLRLDGEPGNKPIGSGVSGDPRGWVSFSETAYEFAPGSPLFIVQHPSGGAMKLALDTKAVIGLNSNKTRVEYNTNTEHGSSGSPCFSQNWELVALHHSGDPSWIPRWNEGVPTSLILNDLKMTDKLHFLFS